MTSALDAKALDQLFIQARSYGSWKDIPVGEEVLHSLYNIMKWGPTSVNSCPARIIFLRTVEAKQRLAPALAPTNVDKMMSAPVTAIVGYDTHFYDQLPRLFPSYDARSWFVDSPDLADDTAKRNSALQGAYLMIAARALGLDCGPMSGFDKAKVDQEFFTRPPENGTSYPIGKIQTNFLCNLGYGDKAKLYPRGPRLPFDTACTIL